MRALRTSIIILFALVFVQPASRASGQPRDNRATGSAWTKTLDDRSRRGELHDAVQKVRGDTGKWNDDARLQPAPSMRHKPKDELLDDWADQLLEREPQLTSNEDSWLIFRTQQLDDNDRVWIERIERRGNQFLVVANLAKWRGWYSKNFTYYGVLGVNLGKLEPGAYEAKWIIKPFAFSRFDQPGAQADAWPKDDIASDERPAELVVTFAVAGDPK